MRDTLENMCSGKQPSRSYSNQNQTEDFGGLKFYDVVGNQQRIFVGEKKVYYQETAEGQAGSEYTEFFFFFEAIETVLGIASPQYQVNESLDYGSYCAK